MIAVMYALNIAADQRDAEKRRLTFSEVEVLMRLEEEELDIPSALPKPGRRRQNPNSAVRVLGYGALTDRQKEVLSEDEKRRL